MAAQARAARWQASAEAASKRRSLTTFSRTGRTTPDTGANAGQPVDHDLRIRTMAHWPDTLY
jgi:hypothetical protein